MQETRRTILNVLKERGQITVGQLSDELNLTPATILHHLNILRGEGLVEMSNLKRRPTPGRPQHVYTLTERANDFFPENYVEFADLTLREIRDRVGLDELESIVRGVAQRMVADVPRPLPDEPLPQRLERAVNFLSQKGYLAHWERTDRGYWLHLSNCPYRALTQQHHEPCLMDQMLLTELLGVKPQRMNWLAAGDMACTYRIPESDPRPLA